MKQVFQNLMQAFYRTVDNKVYMRDVENILKKMESLDLTPQEIQALEYLSRDLVHKAHEKDRLRNQARQPWTRF